MIDLVLEVLHESQGPMKPHLHPDNNPLLEHGRIATCLDTLPEDWEDYQFFSWLFEWLFGYEFRRPAQSKTATPQPADAAETASEHKVNTSSPVKADAPALLLQPGSKLYEKYQGWRKSVLSGVKMGRLYDKL